jgi:hypothetical protein
MLETTSVLKCIAAFADYRSNGMIKAVQLFRKIIEFSNRSRNGIAVDDIIMNASALHDQVYHMAAW